MNLADQDLHGAVKSRSVNEQSKQTAQKKIPTTKYFNRFCSILLANQTGQSINF
jgi:hypothetical protein